MYKSWLPFVLMLVVILNRPGIALAADQERSRQYAQQQQSQRIYGSQLMTEQERLDYRSQMLSAKSAEEQDKIRREHHEKMKLRAAERGLTLPDEIPARGRGMGPPGSGSRPFYGGSGSAGQQLATVDVAAQGSQTSGGIAYLSGGIGDDDPVLQKSADYNLHLVFATKGSGEYLADIKVMVEDTKGGKILAADSPGPIFYARLPAGTYRITAGYQGHSLRKLVTITDRGSRDLYFHWPSENIAANKGAS
jgi:hypothetical protein